MNVRFGRIAARELKKAVEWYDRQWRGLGAEFLDAVAAAVERVRPDPNGWELIASNFRRVPVERFPYSVIFRVDEPAKEIVLVAFAHASRRPAYWRRRWPDR